MPKYINKPFDKLPLKKRAIYILKISGFTYKEIRKIMITSPNFIKLSVSIGKKEYPLEMILKKYSIEE